MQTLLRQDKAAHVYAFDLLELDGKTREPDRSP